MSAARHFCGILAAMFIAGALTTARGADSQPLRYAWKTGEEHAFKTEITIDTDDETDTHSGTPSYRVQSAEEGTIKLQFNSGLHKSSKPKARAGAFPGIPPFPRPPRFGGPTFPQARVLTINDRGKVITEEGESQLPYLLGDLALLPLVPLPKGNEKSWTVSRETTISITQDTGFRHPFFDRRGGDKKLVKADEELVYAISKTEGDLSTIKESYTLEALEQVKGKPSMEMIGDGTYQFDMKLGGPVSYESKLTLVLREGNTTTEIPITISMKRIDTAELEKMRKESAAAAEKAKADADAEMRKPLDPSELTALIDDLNGDDKGAAKKALDKLAKKVPMEPNPNVSAAIERHIISDDFWTRKSAAAAMEKWATQESVPTLLEGLKDKDVFTRASVITAISQFPSKEVAAGLAPLLADGFSRGKAREVLAKMGDMAEEPALEYAKSKDWVTQMEACKVLGEVGGKKSLAVLEPLVSESNGLVQAEAKKAVEAIKKRESKPKTTE